MNQIEEEIKSDLFKDKLKKIFKKYRLFIIFITLILILGPIFYQFNNIYIEKKNQKFLEQYSKAILLIDKKNDKDGLVILNQLKVDANLFIKVLSINSLIEYYLQKNEKNKAIQEIDSAYSTLKNKDQLLSEILSIKKALLIFDKISEAEILDLLKPNNEKKIFRSLSSKILYDYYSKLNQHEKAKLFLNNK